MKKANTYLINLTKAEIDALVSKNTDGFISEEESRLKILAKAKLIKALSQQKNI